MFDCKNKEIRVGNLVEQISNGYYHEKGAIWMITNIGIGITDLKQCAVLKNLDSAIVMFATQEDLLKFVKFEGFKYGEEKNV